MAQTVRAIYEQGQLRLLEDVALSEGQEVNISILSDRDLVRAALGDLVVKFPEEENDDAIDEEALLREIEAELTGDLRLSEAIIEERREDS
ncbi:MAG: antitoxin family protein [Thermomicrobiales bacterium]